MCQARAFGGNTSAVIFDAILNRQVTPLGQLNPAVPPELQKIVGVFKFANPNPSAAAARS